jgi:hypothetical protein
MLRKTFLYCVLEKDKPLFVFFVLFILGQVFFAYEQVETIPFFHFEMYSTVHKAHKSYTIYNITVDKNPVKSLDFMEGQRVVVYNTIALYDEIKQMGFKDPLNKVISKRFSGRTAEYARSVLLNNTQMDIAYQKWLFRYIADMRMIKTPVIEVSKLEVSYRPDGSVAAIDTPQTLFKLRYE